MTNEQSKETATSCTQFGVQYPDGRLVWAETEGGRKGIVHPGRAQIDDPVGRAKFAEDFRDDLRTLGVEPTKELRLRFVQRTVMTTWGPWSEVEA